MSAVLGTNNGMAKLTERDVKRMRMLRRKANVSYGILAQTFNVNKSTVIRVIKRITWRHIR